MRIALGIFKGSASDTFLGIPNISKTFFMIEKGVVVALYLNMKEKEKEEKLKTIKLLLLKFTIAYI